MADSDLGPAKVILLAVQAASKGDIPVLRLLVGRYRKVLRSEIVLRILLTHLPEYLETSNYLDFVKDLASGEILDDSKDAIDSGAVEELSPEEAYKKVRKLHLHPLSWKDAPEGIDDPIVLFLIQRAIRIDESTGLLNQIPDLLSPFLSHSPYLRNWMITSILPLVRLNYEYYPQSTQAVTVRELEALSDHQAIHYLLLSTEREEALKPEDKSVGRDLRGLIGPLLYGDKRWQRRKDQIEAAWNSQAAASLEQAGIINHKYAGWEDVFAWITAQAALTWEIAVKAIEQWDGPGDVDLGGYEDGTEWLDEEEQAHLEQRYAKVAIATAYLIPESSIEALNGVHRILSHIISLLDHDRIPTLEAAAAILSPIPSLTESKHLSSSNAKYLRNGHLEEHNALTNPDEPSTNLLRALLISAYLLTRAGEPCTIRRAGELALLQDEREQKFAFGRMLSGFNNARKTEDKFFIKMRNEVLWLRSWGAEELEEGTDASVGRGIFGKLSKEFIEAELLKVLLANTRYTLARLIYELTPDRPLPEGPLRCAIFAAAMNAFDNATNANRTRGGVKKCEDIMHAFPDTVKDSLEAQETEHLIRVTHDIGQYRLVFKQGEPFAPVNLRVHGDPISIIGKVLDLNERVYTQITDLLRMGQDMVRAGLTVRDLDGTSVLDSSNKQILDEQLSIAEKRIVSMCIDSALADDDFETAYSYVTTRLAVIAGPALTRILDVEPRNPGGLYAVAKPKVLDDWSWRAALQAGRYQRNSQTVRATHIGNASGNPEIRHLEHRMACLTQALRLAPRNTLQEITNVYRRCEEELETHLQREAEQEENWDAQGDGTHMSTSMPMPMQSLPGGFTSTPSRDSTPNANAARNNKEEAPLSLFDLSRESINRAQSGIAALSLFRGKADRGEAVVQPTPEEQPNLGPKRTSSVKEVYRKRDQVRNVAVGALAGGIGWMIGAPAPKAGNEKPVPVQVRDRRLGRDRDSSDEETW